LGHLSHLVNSGVREKEIEGMSQSRFQTLLLLIIILMIFPWANPVLAENIDPLNEGLHYAYGENVGWINFKPSQGPGVTVTGSAVTGYAWGENIGWINLSPANAGVNNNGAGILSGYAWGENIGWINFSPAGGGVYMGGSHLILLERFPSE
jgi:hypothetical protein